MAELIVYDYVGPGEQLTAETLAQVLPDSWRIIAGRALPTPQKDDVDLLVVGENRIFVLEQKHWGPKVTVDNGGWWVKGALRPSPIGRNTQVAKILAGVLKAAVPGYATASKGTHLVEARVVLSYPDLILDTDAYPYDDSQILILDEVAADLQAVDAKPTNLHTVRKQLLTFVGGLAVRTASPNILGPFTVDTEVEGVGRSRVFRGRDADGDPVVLRAYPMDGWGPGVDAKQLVKHERQATKQIADIQRSWSVEATFEDDARRWIILPIRPIASVSLARHAAAGHLQVVNGQSLTDRAANIVLDAFDGLAEVHAKGVVHRGLMPDRILVARNDRVVLRDFYLAHSDSQLTVGPIVADTVDRSVPYRAPESEMVIGAATEKSDVYALALSLLWWINGDVSVKDDAIKSLVSSVGEFGPVAEILHSCLAEEADDRPTAAEAADQLRGLVHPPPPPQEPPSATPVSDRADNVFAVGGTVDHGRYQIELALGHGGFATSWRALDTKTGATRVIKQYTDAAATWQVKQEFDAAQKLNHARCARVWDYSPEPPIYLVADFIEGQSLLEFGQARTASEEDYRQIALDALDGLAYMHGEGSLHRDISPSNIIVKDDGRAVLIDFGLAIARSDAVTVVGTPAYMAPEVLVSGKWSVSADVYALGASLLKVMLNRSPFKDGDKSALELLTLEEEETWGPNGVAILNALFKMVAPNPEERPPSAREYATYLRTVAAPQVEAGEPKVNPTVLNLRRLYRGSVVGNAGNRGLDDDFARETYVDTRLDTLLTPRVIAGDLDVVLLTGNPGDGKTSFLSTLRDYLIDVGAADVTPQTAAGWRMQFENRTYAAVYDASEARDGKTSDEILAAALEGGPEHTALIAINDGRLLNFFSQYSDVYPDCYIEVDRYSRDLPGQNKRIAIVDLKRRSVAPIDTEEGLAGRVLDTFVADKLWTACKSCTARGVCPILANRNLLRGPGRKPLLELVSISHMRRKRRATFRDVRSAMAWTITGDRGCEDVHDAIADGRDLRMADDAMAFDLAFQAGNPDYLVAEWATVDPSVLAAPGVERALRDGTLGLETVHRPGSESRQLFFDGASTSPVGRAEVRAYRYFDEFVDSLAGRIDTDHVRAQVLLGLSRVLGAHGYRGNALALQDGESAGWSVLREIPAEEFTLVPLAADAEYVEQQPDGLRLSHRLGTLVLTLDSYELVRRAADGEVLGDVGSDAVKLELSAFGNLLRTTPAHRVLVVDPAGKGDSVSVASGVITREAAKG